MRDSIAVLFSIDKPVVRFPDGAAKLKRLTR